MMDQCPKCGFNQPDDKYCPQCGVDIERYQPKKLSFTAQILASSSFYLFLAIVIAVATGFLIVTELQSHRLHQDESLAEQQERLLSKPVAGVVAINPSPTQEKSASSLADRAPGLAEAKTPPAAGGPVALTATVATTPSTTLAGAAGARGISRLRLYYVEGLVESFPGGSGYADRETILDSHNLPLDSKARVLSEGTLSDLNLNREVTDSQISEDPRLDRNAHGIGVVTRITLRSNDARSTKLDVNIASRYPDVIGADRVVAVRSNTPPQFQVDLVTSRIFYIGGLVPHRMYGEGEDTLKELVSTNPVLRVMLSPTFAAQRFATDFILLIASSSDSLND